MADKAATKFVAAAINGSSPIETKEFSRDSRSWEPRRRAVIVEPSRNGGS